ncbi:MAG: carboxypeptidase regulatory-like domain-containing protein, partial [Mucilaginibacter sp.]|nr:carboxypeptidase regulatory-like domain-containing protein [Mucilaginibacter sp.]
MKSPNKWVGVFILWMLLQVVCLGQTIQGTVTDSLGKPVSYAGVNLKGNGNLIIAYTTTNNKGAFTLQLPTDANKTGLMLEVSCIGFKKQSTEVAGFTSPYNFKLSMAVNQLKDVVIKNKRPFLRTSGDTLNYKVSDFSSPQDRVIGDVIKKLPGIDVAKDGKISYNGKSISNLYIGGDNLLDDKYNIATNNIPNGVVDQVQVMQNHQPVKMLQGKVNSDDVALNLTIKKDAKLQMVGQETVGAGLPGNYYADLNAMMFKDKYKAINYIKGNNTGLDVTGDLVSHNMNDYLSRIDNDKPATVLSLGTAGDPDLPRNRYLFDQSGILNANNLLNLKNDVQLRLNLSYVRDNQRQDYFKTSDIYLPNDTVHYTETQYNKRRPDLLHTQFNLNINNKKYYLNDALIADYSHNTSYSSLVTNGSGVKQTFKDNLLDASNELNYMQTFKNNNIIEGYSYINHSTEPENRVIEQGLNPNIFNHNIPYAQLTQNANVPSFFTNNYLSYKIPGQYVTQSYKAGFSLQSQSLTSDLNVTQLNNTTNLVADSTKNNLDWKRNKLYTEAAFDIPGDILKVNVSLPLTLLGISYNDQFYKLDKSLRRLYFDPRLSVKYQTGIENFVQLNYGFKNGIGGIQDVYRGEILTNYRSLYANNADLTERQTQNASIGFNYRKAITLFFFSVNASYVHQNANNIASSVLTNNLQQRIVLPFDNNIDSWSFGSYVSKYSFSLRTT